MVVGMVVGLVSLSSEIVSVETIRWSWGRNSHFGYSNLVGVLVGGLASVFACKLAGTSFVVQLYAGLFCGLVGGLTVRYFGAIAVRDVRRLNLPETLGWVFSSAHFLGL